ncbi:MAG: MMPL family transporter [Dehalococcoidales bacterium]|nr:MMPL family transporter [Dehalococcoidales bacterium]
MMFAKLGAFVVKYRVWFIMVWVVAAVLMYLFAPSLNEVGTLKESAFLPKDSESLRARELIEEYFPHSKAVSTVTLVFHNPGGLSEADMTYARKVRDWLASGSTPFEVRTVSSVFDNEALASRLISPDGTTMLLSAGLKQAAIESKSLDTVRAIRGYLDAAEAPAGLEVYVSGQVGVYADLFASLMRSVDLTTIITVVLVIVLLIIIYRSPVAALVPLLTIGMAYLVAHGVLGYIGAAGVPIWSQLDVFLIVLVFGIGTDYCLFLVSRFYEELGKSDSRVAAMRTTVGRIGEVISASAMVVIVGLAGMVVARYEMIKTMGPVLGVAIFITLLGALTLAPALASVFGKKLFWPRHDQLGRGKPVAPSRFWSRIAGFATGRPVLTIAIVVIVMLVPYLALPQLNRSFDQVAELPPDADSVVAFRVLEKHYDIGEMEPVTVVVVAPPGRTLTEPGSLEALRSLSASLRGVSSVIKVQGITSPDGSPEPPAALTASGQLSSMGDNITATLARLEADPSLIVSGNLTEGFSALSRYLDELSANFPWVKEEPSYQKLTDSVASLRGLAGEIKSSALVENQLTLLSMQMLELSRALGTSGGNLSTASIDTFTALKGYLDGLAQKYPEIRANEGYQTANGILTQIGMALISARWEALQELLPKLPGYLEGLSGAFARMADHFRGSGEYFFSSQLARLAPLPAADRLKTEIQSLTESITALARRFRDNGNPLFFPSSVLESPRVQEMMDVFLSADRRAGKIFVMLDAYPYSEEALSAIPALREKAASGLRGTALEGAEVAIGGVSADLSDVHQIMNRDFNWVLLIVVVATFVVLGLLLRSIVAPVYLLLSVLFSYGTTMGIVSWIFQDILGQEGISFLIPIIVFVLLVALGSDYNIFLMSRVREETTAFPGREGTRLATSVTGGVITACGIILAGTFVVLVGTPIRTLVQIGAAVSIGVLIDTFIVRALLVPAIASLLGRWNWWPSRHGT